MARNAALYDEDFYGWTMEQARLLRAGEFARLDIENVAEELESIGRRDRREIDGRLVVLLSHILKAGRVPIADLVGDDPRAAPPDRKSVG